MENELISRKVPYSAAAEHAVLGAMLIEPIKCIPEAVNLLNEEDFYIPENKVIFSTILNMFNLNRPVDAITLTDELQLLGQYDEAGGQSYLTQILEITPTAANMREYAQIVKEKAVYIFFQLRH